MEILRRDGQSWAIAVQHVILSSDEVREEEDWNLGNLNQLPPALLKRYADECRGFATTMRIVERKLHPIAGFSGSAAFCSSLYFHPRNITVEPETEVRVRTVLVGAVRR